MRARVPTASREAQSNRRNRLKSIARRPVGPIRTPRGESWTSTESGASTSTCTSRASGPGGSTETGPHSAPTPVSKRKDRFGARSALLPIPRACLLHREGATRPSTTGIWECRVRGEMGDMAGQETTDYRSKLVRLEQALATIRPGSRIYLGTGCAAPRSLLAGWRGCNPARPTSSSSASSPHRRCRWRRAPPRPATAIGRSSSAATSDSLAGSGQLDYVPISLEEVPAAWRADGCRSTWPCFRCPRPMPEASSASACPWTSRLRC